MAEFTTEFKKDTVQNGIKKKFNKAKGGKPVGVFPVTGSTVVLPTDYDVIFDKIQLMQFPDECNLWGVSVTGSEEYDTGGTALRMGLVLDNGTHNTFTTAVGSAFANAPSNDGLELVSSDNNDTMNVTIYGTTTSTDTVVVETIALTGTSQAATVKTDWGQILAVSIDSAPAGTVTIREASGNQSCTTLTSSVLSRGFNTVTDTAFYNRLVRIVASEASTKQIGLVGTDADGTVIYDSQALSGTTAVFSNSRFNTVTSVLTGDLAATTTATITGTDALLATASQFLTGDPVPLNWTGNTLPGTELGLDVSGQTLSLLIEAAPTTGNSSNITLTHTALISIGSPVELGTSQA